MSAARIVGRHLWRSTIRYLKDGDTHLRFCWLNITCASKGLGTAARSARAVMNRSDFRHEYPQAILCDLTYQGTIDT